MNTKTVNDRRAKGLFWDKAWKLVEGCRKVSPGCDNCWSETETVMRSGHPNDKIRDRAQQVVGNMPGYPDEFTGNILLRHDNLDLPLRTKKPTVWAIWNDLYHEDVPEKFIDEVYGHIRMASQHTFLILTKRAERMASYLNPNYNFDCPWGENDNVFHGVTAENQQTADERIPHLLRVPGQRFLSLEPMLGAISLGGLDTSGGGLGIYRSWLDPIAWPCGIHQALLGGESGKHARPLHPDWARSARDQCAAASVPYYFKQWGEWLPDSQNGSMSGPIDQNGAIRVGKKKAGRLLDGRLHDDLAWGDKP